MCAKAVNQVERQEHIPRQLLRAIAKIESGRYHAGKQLVMAWPWTVMAEGRGRYLATKDAAIAEVSALWARGVRNIDVGCMQVNLQYHPDAFADLEEAFDPLTNVRYAASFLKTMALEQGSWAKAVAYYHSQDPDRYRRYRAKVHATWQIEHAKFLAALEQARSKQRQVMALAAEVAPASPARDEAGASDDPPLMLAALRFASAPPPGVAAAPPVLDAARDALAAPLVFARAGPAAIDPPLQEARR